MALIVLEYMEGGEVLWKDTEDKPILPLQDARSIFRDVVLGLEYRTFIPSPVLSLTLNEIDADNNSVLNSQFTCKASFTETSSQPICSCLPKVPSKSQTLVSPISARGMHWSVISRTHPSYPRATAPLHPSIPCRKGLCSPLLLPLCRPRVRLSEASINIPNTPRPTSKGNCLPPRSINNGAMIWSWPKPLVVPLSLLQSFATLVRTDMITLDENNVQGAFLETCVLT